MKKSQIKGNWGNRSDADRVFQIGFDFVTQLLQIMSAKGISRARLAKKLDVSQGRVSQVLNNPGNVTAKIALKYSAALGCKFAMVIYDDSDPKNERGPIHSQIFTECWIKRGQPHDFFELNPAPRSTTLTMRPSADGGNKETR